MVEVELHYTRRGFYVVDHDTGDEILCFQRRNRVFCYLRDRNTRFFIRLLRYFYIQYIGVFERCYEGGCRKGKGCSPLNNLHVECHEFEQIFPSDYNTIGDLERDIRLNADILPENCTSCFDYFSVSPEEEEILFRSVEANSECYMDRCEE